MPAPQCPLDSCAANTRKEKVGALFSREVLCAMRWRNHSGRFAPRDEAHSASARRPPTSIHPARVGHWEIGRHFLAAVVALGVVASPSFAQPTRQRPHPAVVRVIAPERSAMSAGSGALVAVNERHGLVITNWHVVRDATAPVMVVFPDGFSSFARVLKTDRDWDLAALLIWRPRAQPIRLADAAPRRGDVLTIAGYGSGSYRAVSGRCVTYVAPAAWGRSLPAEMIELSASARNGDSGGPILNHRGELTGVLFGSGFGRTMGSYCGRVRRFLSSVMDDFQRSPPPSTMIAQHSAPGPPPLTKAAEPRYQPEPEPVPAPVGRIVGRPHAVPKLDPVPRPLPGNQLAQAPPSSPPGPPSAQVSISASPEPSSPKPPASPPPAGPTRLDQIKTILAVVGLIALLFHSLRLVAVAAES